MYASFLNLPFEGRPCLASEAFYCAVCFDDFMKSSNINSIHCFPVIKKPSFREAAEDGGLGMETKIEKTSD